MFKISLTNMLEIEGLHCLLECHVINARFSYITQWCIDLYTYK